MTAGIHTDPFLAKVWHALEHRHGLNPHQHILAAVSGGADSMALLHALARLGYPIEVMHFDHHTRHGASGEDASFVEGQARQLGVPYHIQRAAPEAWEKTAGRSFEAAARAARYSFFDDVARARPGSVIATGHQADDQAETLLMRLMNFGGNIGMAGIPMERKAGNAIIIRPLLDCARTEIQIWLQENDIPWREDITNRELEYHRNRARHEILPFLERHAPSIRRNLAKLADFLHTDTAFLDETAAERLGALTCPLPPSAPPNLLLILDRRRYAGLPPALRRHLLRALSFRHGLEMTYERMLEAEWMLIHGGTGKRCDLGKGYFLEMGREQCFFARSETCPSEPAVPVPLAIPGTTRAFGYAFEARLLGENDLALEAVPGFCSPLRQVFDLDTLSLPVVARAQVPGDRMTPFGRSHDAPMAQWFKDWGVPRILRDTRPLIADTQQILWVVGCRRNQKALVTPATKSMLVLEAAPLGCWPHRT